MQRKSIQRICKFASCTPPAPPITRCSPQTGAFEAYGQRNYTYMKNVLAQLRSSRDLLADGACRLRRPYDDSIGVFPCRSFNLGEQSISFPHTDDGNLAQSWCSITPLGRFDPTCGGHLVLWDFGLVIEFPPGATVLIPSALIRHSNTSLQAGETRYSMIQYAAGGLFRWVHHGCKTEEEWRARATVDEIKAHKHAQEG